MEPSFLHNYTDSTPFSYLILYSQIFSAILPFTQKPCLLFKPCYPLNV
ncbi:hypothetical protein ACM6L3_09960 [Paenibacillus larvae]